MIARIINFLIRKHWSQITTGSCASISSKDRKLIKTIIEEGITQEGPHIKKFENKFKEFLGVKYCKSFVAGRVGLYAILRSLGVKPGDEIIVPAFTCVVVPYSIKEAKAKPVYVDIDPKTFNADPESIKTAITKKTKAIIVQHTFGFVADIKKISKIAKKRNIPIIEDCAQSLGAEYYGKKTGTFGKASFYSFDYSKNITMAQGGMVATNDKELFKKISEEYEKMPFPKKSHIRSKLDDLSFFSKWLSPTRYPLGTFLVPIRNMIRNIRRKRTTRSISPEEVGCLPKKQWAYKMPESFAKVGLLQLEKIESLNSKRRKIAAQLNKTLKTTNFQLPKIIKNSKPVYLRYPLIVEEREKIIKVLERNQVSPGNWFNAPIYPSKEPARFDYSKGSCPKAENTAQRIINIPTDPRLSLEQVQRINRVIKRFSK